MGLLLLLVVVALCRLAWRGTPFQAFAVFVGTIALVPGSLTLPALPGILTVHRVVLVVAGLGLLRRCHRRELPWSIWRPPALAWRLLLVVGLFGLLGLGLLQPHTDAGVAARSWEAMASQLPVLLVAVAFVRAIDDLPQALSAIVVAAVATGVVALGEAATGLSYARAWFHLRPSLLGLDQAQVLATRGSHVRVRAASDFTLAFTWVTEAMVPLLLVLAVVRRSARRVLLLLGFPVLVAAVVLTYSRTAVVPLILVVVVLGVLLRTRDVRVAAGALFAVAVFEVASGAALVGQFSTTIDTGSIDVRVERLPVVGALVAGHPWTGLGLGGLVAQGITVTDSSYLQAYGEVGVLGLAALVAVLLSAVLECATAMRTPARPDRLVALGATLSLVVLLLGTFTFDAFAAPAVAETFWVVAAVGVVAQDGLRAPRPVPMAVRAAAVGAALLAGLVLVWTAPTHTAQTWRFDALLPYPATVQAATYTGSQLRSTVCVLAEEAARPRHITCQDAGDGPGQGILRLEAPTTPALLAERDRVLAAVHQARPLAYLQLEDAGAAHRGSPTGLRTAWGWLPLLVGLLVLPVPGRRTPA